MGKERTKRAHIRALSFTMATVLALAGGCFYWYQQARQTQRQLEAVYLRGLGELGDYMTGITNTLSKGIYAGTPAQMTTLSAQLWRDAGSAKTALASLPAAEIDLTEAYRFLSQVGDYAVRLSSQVTSGEVLTDEQAASLEGMLQFSQQLTDVIYRIEDQVRRGEVSLLRVDTGDTTHSSGSAQEQTANSSALAEASKLEGYATLIYDGPFSDHMLEIEPRMTKDAAEITPEQAQQVLQKIFGEKQDFSVTGEENSVMASYRLQGGDYTAAVTKYGGYLAYLTCGRTLGSAIIDAKKAVSLASDFLADLGYRDMKPTYYEAANGECTVNFAYSLDGVICYPDLVKIGVALDNGEVVFADARGYLVNHYERSLPEDVVSPDQAQQSLGTALETITYVGRAVIPTEGGSEKLCHEFSATGRNGHNLLCYVNTQTGAEERILILIETENGVLTA